MFRIGVVLLAVLAGPAAIAAEDGGFTLNGCPYTLGIPEEFKRGEERARTGGNEVVTFRAAEATLEFEYSGDTLEDVRKYHQAQADDPKFETFTIDGSEPTPIFMGWSVKDFAYFNSAAIAGCGADGIVEMTMVTWRPTPETERLFKAMTARLAEVAD